MWSSVRGHFPRLDARAVALMGGYVGFTNRGSGLFRDTEAEDSVVSIYIGEGFRNLYKILFVIFLFKDDID